MNYRLLVDTAVLAGEMMLVAGAETYRVEDTISRILKTSGLEQCDAFVVSTGIMVTLSGPGVDAISIVKRIGEKITNLSIIYEVNDISRKYCSGEITIEEAYEKLCMIPQGRKYPEWLISLCTIATAASFTALLGGGLFDCIFAACNGALIWISKWFAIRIRLNTFVKNMAVSFCIALISMWVDRSLMFPVQMELLIAGSIMPLLPGVALTNAIRDTLQGDYMSGGARAIEAFVIAASLAVGIGAGLMFGRAIHLSNDAMMGAIPMLMTLLKGSIL